MLEKSFIREPEGETENIGPMLGLVGLPLLVFELDPRCGSPLLLLCGVQSLESNCTPQHFVHHSYSVGMAMLGELKILKAYDSG